MRIRTHSNPLSCTQHFEKLDVAKIRPELTEFNGKIDFEIGFGQSIFIRNHAKNHPSRLVVGVEVRKKTVEVMQERVDADNIKNIHLVFGNGSVCLAEMFENNSLENIFIFHPDPWLKRRHLKRRLVNPDLLITAQQKLKIGGRIYVSTDVEALWIEMHKTFKENPNFTEVEDSDFWTNYYQNRWDDISKEKGRQTYFGTFELRGK
ncbi:MAG: tRNA (guanosine(46)-N7)-methyltransferase TrmB [bacterium]